MLDITCDQSMCPFINKTFNSIIHARSTDYCLSNKLDRPSNQFFLSVCQYVCLWTDRFSNDYVHNSLPFSRNFVCGSEMWSLRRLLFARQTGSSLPILEVCGFRFQQFSGFGDHIFHEISTKSHIQIKFSNADIVFSGEWNRKIEIGF